MAALSVYSIDKVQAEDDSSNQPKSCDLSKDFFDAVDQYCVYRNGMYTIPKNATSEITCAQLIGKAISKKALAKHVEAINEQEKEALVTANKFTKELLRDTHQNIDNLKRKLTINGDSLSQEEKADLIQALEIEESQAALLKEKIKDTQQLMTSCGLS